MWLITFPLLATMLLTMWDVRRDSKKKWYVPKLRLCAHNLNICREKGWLT